MRQSGHIRKKSSYRRRPLALRSFLPGCIAKCEPTGTLKTDNDGATEPPNQQGETVCEPMVISSPQHDQALFCSIDHRARTAPNMTTAPDPCIASHCALFGPHAERLNRATSPPFFIHPYALHIQASYIGTKPMSFSAKRHDGPDSVGCRMQNPATALRYCCPRADHAPGLKKRKISPRWAFVSLYPSAIRPRKYSCSNSR